MRGKIIQDHEEWFKSAYPATYRDAKEGRDFDALCHFDHSLAGWQASRAALVVELPLPAHNDWHEYDQGFNAAHSECRNAIHASGVKTR